MDITTDVKEYWYLAGTAMEYNDEGYSTVEDGIDRPNKLYTTYEAAAAAQKTFYKEFMHYIGIRDLSEWYWPDEGEWLHANTPYNVNWNANGQEGTFWDAIEYCEANELDWFPHFPDMVHIYHITVEE